MISIKKIFLLLYFFSAGSVMAQKPQNLYAKAIQFINTLSPTIKAQMLFTLSDSERINMNYVPIERKGPTFHDFNPIQRKAALELLRASLSKEGYRKATEIIELETVLAVIENNERKMPDGTPVRDPLNYHFCIFGDPSATNTWGWRFEGHHISLNFTSANGKVIAATPSFFGTNPAISKNREQVEKEVLKKETALGFALINSLTENQLANARFSNTAPPEIISANSAKANSLDPKGIAYSSLSSNQQKLFMELLNVYINNYEWGFSKTLRTKVYKAGIENLFFAWAGSLSPGAGHYYRIQGPELLIEYDNTQNNANHVHSVVRDLTNDYGRDLLKEHYVKEHSKQ
ncbi:MAG: DUF3500 domain-containing protein [Chitinophagaceae bacterium]